MRLRSLLLVTALAAATPLTAQTAEDENGIELPSDLRIFGPSDPNVRKATALVNGEVITDTDVEQRLNLVLTASGGRITGEERERLRMQVLRNLIDEKLQVQEARSHDVVISDEEVNQTFDRVATQFKRTPKDFGEYLQSNGSSANTLKQQILGELAWNRLLRRRIEPFVNVGDDEVTGIISKLEAAKGTEEYRVGEIYLSATPVTREEVRANAARIVGQIRGGSSFVAYARQFSEASTAGVGGDLGWVRQGQLPDAVGKVVPTLTVGQVSDPIDVPGGIMLVALTEKRQVLSADPARAVLSLKQISVEFPAGMTEAQAAPRVEALNNATRAMGGCGRAEAAATQVGGEVVQNEGIRLADLPPQLRDIVGRLGVGEATPPFGSLQDGVRVLVLCGRDDAAASVPSFDEVYAQLNDQRINMRARRYLRDLRRDAVVDYR
jgi:peptidyl-prolyl cis-trans isomerase SurA